MTPTPSTAMGCRRVTILGAGAVGQAVAAELLSAGLTDFRITDDPTGDEVVRSVFDEDTDTWALHTAGGAVLRSRVVISARPPLVPWTPNLPGGKDFRGVSFHAARWDPDFDPARKRVAVVGGDATVSHHLERLVEAAASVTVFPHPPRRIVAELPSAATRAKRWLRVRVPKKTPGPGARPAPVFVGCAIAGLTPSGIRTRDGVDHSADAIVYGTGFAVDEGVAGDMLVGAGGVTIRRAWGDGMEPYLGVALHGFPNYFVITGPDTGAQARYVLECLRVMTRTAASRIEVRHSSQQVFNERACARPTWPASTAAIAKTFNLSSGRGDESAAYEGAATLTVGGLPHPVRVRLTGRLDPIDGQYHWQGTLFGSTSQPLSDQLLQQSRTVTLKVGDRNAPARIVEKTPWGTHSVAGVGAPPYAPS